MKTLAQIISSAQELLNKKFNLPDSKKRYACEEHTVFWYILRVVEAAIEIIRREYKGIGRKPYQYKPFIAASLAKSYFKIEKTSALIQRLKAEPDLREICGFDKVPGKATFSRNFSVLANAKFFNEAQCKMAIKEYENSFVIQVSRDSTAIEARETVKKKEKKEKKVKKQRGRPKKGEKREPAPENRIEKQKSQTPEEAVAELDKDAAWGCKKNSQGNVCFWKGYKLHLDITDTGYPLLALITGANVHDSQLAIPMEMLTGQRVPFCYSLMDAGYDAKAIDEFIRSQGRIPIIAPNNRGNDKRPPLDPAKKERFKFRSGVERANGYLKDNLLPSIIYVKSYIKVSFVLMSAVVCLAAIRTLQRLAA